VRSTAWYRNRRSAVAAFAFAGKASFQRARAFLARPTIIPFVRGELIAEAYAALDAGDVAPLEALLDQQVKWIGVGGSWGETPT